MDGARRTDRWAIGGTARTRVVAGAPDLSLAASDAASVSASVPPRNGDRLVGCGGASVARVATLLGEADRIARRIHHPHATGLVSLVDGIAKSLRGLWGESVEALDRAEQILSERCPGAGWERG